MKKYLFQVASDKKNDLLSNILKIILFVLSKLYGAVIYLLKLLYKKNIIKSYKIPCILISVGNITLGGTGKTPFEELIAGYLIKKEKNVVILTRGYGAKTKIVGSSGEDLLNISDEAFILRKNLNIPVLEGKDRVNSARLAISKFQANTIILDDAFQHWRIKRDLDIVVINGANPFGNKKLIPRGILRENLDSLKRAGVILLNKVDYACNVEDTAGVLRRINPKALIIKSVYKQIGFNSLFNAEKQYSLDFIRDKRICVVCGIGDPDYFEKKLKDLAAKIMLAYQFEDHYQFKEKDLVDIMAECNKEDIDKIIITQKDAAKLVSFNPELFKDGPEVLILRIAMEIAEGKDELFKRLDSLYIS